MVDVNVVVSATDKGNFHHGVAREWLAAAFDRREMIGFSWMVVTGFLRLSTRASVFDRPLTVQQASEQMDEWLERPSARLVPELEDHWPRLRQLLANTGQGGNLVMDAHLAALALSHRAAVASFDRDFSRFPGVHWIDLNPARGT